MTLLEQISCLKCCLCLILKKQTVHVALYHLLLVVYCDLKRTVHDSVAVVCIFHFLGALQCALLWLRCSPPAPASSPAPAATEIGKAWLENAQQLCKTSKPTFWTHCSTPPLQSSHQPHPDAFNLHLILIIKKEVQSLVLPISRQNICRWGWGGRKSRGERLFINRFYTGSIKWGGFQDPSKLKNVTKSPCWNLDTLTFMVIHT